MTKTIDINLFGVKVNIRYYFRNVSEACKKGVEDHFPEKKLNQIEKLLKPEEKDLSQLTVRVEHFEKHNAFEAKIELACGKSVFFGQEDSHDIKKAVDLATKRLIAQIKK